MERTITSSQLVTTCSLPRTPTPLLQRHGVSSRLCHGGDHILVLRGAADEAHDDVLALRALEAAVGNTRGRGNFWLQQVTQCWQGLSMGRVKVACRACTVPTKMDFEGEPTSRSNLQQGTPARLLKTSVTAQFDLM